MDDPALDQVAVVVVEDGGDVDSQVHRLQLTQQVVGLDDRRQPPLPIGKAGGVAVAAAGDERAGEEQIDALEQRCDSRSVGLCNGWNRIIARARAVVRCK